MKASEYIGSLVLNGQLVNFGCDDYGQCYFIEFIDDEGHYREVGLGTYNNHFIEEATALVDYKGYYISIYGMDKWNERLNRFKKCWEWDGYTTSEIENLVKEEDSFKFEIYNYESLYDKLESQYQDN